jgi:hypothetical protein
MPNAPRRPGALIFVAILLIVFGGYSIVNSGGTAWYAVLIASGNAEENPNAKVDFTDVMANLQFVGNKVPGGVITILGFAVVDVLFGVVQLGCAIGILRLAPAARTATIGLVWAEFVYVIVKDVFGLIVIVPAQIEFIKLHPMQIQGPQDQGMVEMMTVIMQVVTYGVVCAGFVFQLFVVVLVVWILSTERTRAAFAGRLDVQSEEEQRPSASRSPYAGYDDEDA